MTTRALLAAAAAFVLVVSAARAQTPPPVVPLEEPPPFDVWIAALKDEALGRGIRVETIEAAFTGVRPVQQILERDRAQAEFVLDLDVYLKRRLAPETVRIARQMHARHAALLDRVSRAYGVPSRVIVAVWGLESNFGRFAGVRPTIPTLVTLAYDPRRSTLFRNELFAALQILDDGHIELPRLRGSWAGALGQPQFMPSSYLKYAQDFDGDGKADIWSSYPDIFASIAYYLQQHGWKEGFIWGREVRVAPAAQDAVAELPRREEGCRARRLMTDPRPLAEWQQLGVRTISGAALPKAEVEASLFQVGSRTFLAYDNYSALLGYNCAHSYALSVALLADRLE